MSDKWLLVSLLAALGCGSSDAFPPLPEPTYRTASEVDASLAGLSFADFVEQSYGALLERSPEALTDLGLAETFGRRDDLLDDVSDAFLQGTYDVADVIRTRLGTYDRQALSAGERLTYDVYAWYLDDVAGERPFVHNGYSLNGGLGSEDQRLISLFTQVHPVASQANAEDYVQRLWRVRRRIDQTIVGLEARQREGKLPPQNALAPAVRSLEQLAAEDADTSPFITGLEERLAFVAGVDRATKDGLRAEARRAYRLSVKPAFQDLSRAAQRVFSSAPAGDGVWGQADGDAYYAYLLRHHTTLDLTADQIHERGLAAVAALQQEVRQDFVALGLPQNQSLVAGFTSVRNAAGTVPAADVIDRYAEIIADATARLGPAIDVVPRAAVEVRSDPVGGYYVAGSPDGSRPGVFYAFVGTQGNPTYTMKTLAYHEAVPGHHLQIGLAREQTDLPTLRRALIFTAHAEGWALYAEQVASELDFYGSDAYGDLGRLQYALLRAARLVVDTGIHARRWTFAQGRAYMDENVGFPSDVYYVAGEVGRYISWPGQATAYRIGMDAMTDARAAVRTRLGAAYDPRAFHRVLLKAGSLPLPVLEAMLQEATFGP